MVFQKRYRYRFGDMDLAGIAYYPGILHYYHVAFEDWWQDGLGVPYPQVIHEHRFGLPAVHLDVDYVSPIRYGDEPDVSVGVLRLGHTSVEMAFWMRVGERLANRGRVVTVSVDMRTMQKQPIPERWRALLASHRIDASEFPSRDG